MENGGGERKRERDLAWPRQKKARQREEEQPRPCFFRNVPRFSISGLFNIRVKSWPGKQSVGTVCLPVQPLSFSIVFNCRSFPGSSVYFYIYYDNVIQSFSFSIVFNYSFQILECTFIYIITVHDLSRFRSFSFQIFECIFIYITITIHDLTSLVLDCFQLLFIFRFFNVFLYILW